MDLQQFLAMTAAEFALCPKKPKNTAWMACHFSPYDTGLSNLPRALPNGSMLILNDRIPICGHDPQQVAAELTQAAEALLCSCILLDFQRKDSEETACVVDAVLQAAALPVGVSEYYAAQQTCPVFVSAPPLNVTLDDHIAPWHGREIWLEAALDAVQLTVTEKGCSTCPLPCCDPAVPVHHDSQLCCSYHTQLQPNAAVFRLYRTADDLSQLLCHAQNLGIARCVSLYQQFSAQVSENNG